MPGYTSTGLARIRGRPWGRIAGMRWCSLEAPRPALSNLLLRPMLARHPATASQQGLHLSAQTLQLREGLPLPDLARPHDPSLLSLMQHDVELSSGELRSFS